MPIVPEANLFDFFRESVERAHSATRVPVGQDTRLYLAQLLVDRARTDRPAPAETTLAELHARASCAGPAEKATTYRELGDRSLVCLGLFRKSLDRKTVGASYYAEMGSAAYQRADDVFKRCFADAFGDVFEELARHFGGCVALLADIRAEHHRRSAERLALSATTADPGMVALLGGKPGNA
ncbi:MAG: hypothetical protein H0V89_08155 [Deltaproteobacteria bacterium]|nr:hypothetical protein [Deltaproteobacteria bacterium]